MNLFVECCLVVSSFCEIDLWYDFYESLYLWLEYILEDNKKIVNESIFMIKEIFLVWMYS